LAALPNAEIDISRALHVVRIRRRPRDRLPLRGTDASAVLGEFCYGREDIQRLVSSGAVGRTEWAMNAPS